MTTLDFLTDRAPSAINIGRQLIQRAADQALKLNPVGRVASSLLEATPTADATRPQAEWDEYYAQLEAKRMRELVTSLTPDRTFSELGYVDSGLDINVAPGAVAAPPAWGAVSPLDTAWADARPNEDVSIPAPVAIPKAIERAGFTPAAAQVGHLAIAMARPEFSTQVLVKPRLAYGAFGRSQSMVLSIRNYERRPGSQSSRKRKREGKSQSKFMAKGLSRLQDASRAWRFLKGAVDKYGEFTELLDFLDVLSANIVTGRGIPLEWSRTSFFDNLVSIYEGDASIDLGGLLVDYAFESLQDRAVAWAAPGTAAAYASDGYGRNLGLNLERNPDVQSLSQSLRLWNARAHELASGRLRWSLGAAS